MSLVLLLVLPALIALFVWLTVIVADAATERLTGVRSGADDGRYSGVESKLRRPA